MTSWKWLHRLSQVVKEGVHGPRGSIGSPSVNSSEGTQALGSSITHTTRLGQNSELSIRPPSLPSYTAEAGMLWRHTAQTWGGCYLGHSLCVCMHMCISLPSINYICLWTQVCACIHTHTNTNTSVSTYISHMLVPRVGMPIYPLTRSAWRFCIPNTWKCAIS